LRHFERHFRRHCPAFRLSRRQSHSRSLKEKQPMQSILHAATPWGYCCQVIDNGEIVREYSAGNCGRDSQAVVAPGSPDTVQLAQLKRWAEQTARDIADEWAIPPDQIAYAPDLEAELRESSTPAH
jgi:hypothetical protein